MITVPVTVCAKNEARSIGGTLDALLAACRYAAAHEDLGFEICVVLDDTTDETESVVRRYPGVLVRWSTGGKVEAQRAGLRPGPFTIFCDADVRVSEDAVLAVCSVLFARPEVLVATCPLRPLPPRRRTPLARALHTYNLRRGFSSQRTWFNGKFFALRRWHVPTREALAPRIARLRPDPFYDFDAGLVVDDIYLSRELLRSGGPEAIAEAPFGVVHYRAPETWRGMHRYYRRMRRELERQDLLFPETAFVHRAHGRRRADLLDDARTVEKMHYALFSVALAASKAAYVVERAWVRHVRRSPRPWWRPIEETKVW
jgi:glycosyltransferase involved in cell wall biosynthesis